MRVANPIGYQASYDTQSILEAIRFGKQNGFQAVELHLLSPNFQPERISSAERRAIRDENFILLFHVPTNFSFFIDDKIRLATIGRLKEYIDFAEELAAYAITVHLGRSMPLATQGKILRTWELWYEQEYERLYSSLKDIGTYMQGKRLFFCIENTSEMRYPLSYEVLESLLPELPLYLTWDIGHSNTLDHDEKQREEAFFLRFLYKVKNVHLHDNWGKVDEHNVIGEGNINWGYYLELLDSKERVLTLEIRPRELAVLGMKRLLNVWHHNNKLTK